MNFLHRFSFVLFASTLLSSPSWCLDEGDRSDVSGPSSSPRRSLDSNEGIEPLQSSNLSATTLTETGLSLLDDKRFEEARDHFLQAKSLLTDNDNLEQEIDRMIAHSSKEAGLSLFEEGRFDEAKVHFEYVISLLSDKNTPETNIMLVQVLNRLSHMAHENKDYEEFVRLAHQTYDVSKNAAIDEDHQRTIKGTLGEAHMLRMAELFKAQRYTEARQHGYQADKFILATRDRKYRLMYLEQLNTLTQLAVSESQFEDAIKFQQRRLEIGLSLKLKESDIMIFKYNLANTLYKSGKYRSAEELITSCLETYRYSDDAALKLHQMLKEIRVEKKKIRKEICEEIKRVRKEEQPESAAMHLKSRMNEQEEPELKSLFWESWLEVSCELAEDYKEQGEYLKILDLYEGMEEDLKGKSSKQVKKIKKLIKEAEFQNKGKEAEGTPSEKKNNEEKLLKEEKGKEKEAAPKPAARQGKKTSTPGPAICAPASVTPGNPYRSRASSASSSDGESSGLSRYSRSRSDSGASRELIRQHSLKLIETQDSEEFDPEEMTRRLVEEYGEGARNRIFAEASRQLFLAKKRLGFKGKKKAASAGKEGPNYTVVFSRPDLEDEIPAEQKKKFDVLLEELKRDPRRGRGKPETLTGNLQGHMSRKLNKEHRLVYTIDEENRTVTIMSVHGHYGD